MREENAAAKMRHETMSPWMVALELLPMVFLKSSMTRIGPMILVSMPKENPLKAQRILEIT
jgi:hypothetical protein